MLNFIGCGSAFNTALGNNGAFIKHGDMLFMIDCGSNTFDRLLKSNILEDVNHINVLLTHTHPDHIGSLGDLIFYSYYAMGEIMQAKLTVYSPYDLSIRHILKGFGVAGNQYILNQFEHNGGIHYGDFHLQFEAIPVQHVEELKCFGYIIKYESKIVYYSGDSNEIPQNVLDSLHDGDIDVFYQDTCKADYEGNVHLSLRELDELILPDERSKVFCMHLDNGFDIGEAKGLGFNVVSAIL